MFRRLIIFIQIPGCPMVDIISSVSGVSTEDLRTKSVGSIDLNRCNSPNFVTVKNVLISTFTLVSTTSSNSTMSVYMSQKSNSLHCLNCLNFHNWPNSLIIISYHYVDLDTEGGLSLDPWLFMVINFPSGQGPHVQLPTALLGQLLKLKWDKSLFETYLRVEKVIYT